jgi:hypothetical protein
MKKIFYYFLLVSVALALQISCSEDEPAPTSKSTATDILNFTIGFQTGAADIDATSHTVAVEVANGTNLGGLLAEFTISARATSDPATGTIKDYTNPLAITVTAEDGTTTQTWTVTVTEAGSGPSDATDILSFSFPEQIDIVGSATNHTIDVVVTNGTALTALTPTFTLSVGATSDPATGIVDDYTSPVIITVTAEDGETTQPWTVTVTAATNISSETDFLTFSITGQTNINYDLTAHTINVTVANGTGLTSLTAVFTLSPGATSDPASGVEDDYSSPVTITVTAEDETTVQPWTVTVTEASESGETTVVFGEGGTTKATGIHNLVVDGVTYDVVFEEDLAVNLFGGYPGTYTFTEVETARTAAEAMNIALNDALATNTGPVDEKTEQRYRIAYKGEVSVGGKEKVIFWLAKYNNPSWENEGSDEELYDSSNSEQSFAIFTVKN